MKSILSAGILTLGILAAGCGGGGESRDAAEGTGADRRDEAMATSRGYTYEQREEYREDLQRRLEALRDRITELLEKARESETPITPEMQARIDALRAEHDRVSDRLGEIASATSDDWNTWMTGVERDWEGLDRRVSAYGDTLGMNWDHRMP